MENLTEILRSALFSAGELIEVLLNIISLLVIVVGVILSLVKSPRDVVTRMGIHPKHTYFRRLFGGWLIVALEFQLAADIVGTIISPNYEQLITLGAVAVIRTFLNYFLSRELNETSNPTLRE